MTNHPNRSIRSRAVQFAMGKVLQASDCQEVQDALANHTEFGPWLADDEGKAQSIIRDAEKNLGNRVPAHYAN